MSLAPAPGGRDPKNRLIVLVGTMLCVLMAMYSCHQYSNPARSTAGADAQEMIVADDRATVGQPLKDVPAVDTMSEYHVLDFVADDDAQPYQAQELNRIRVALQEVFGWLKNRSHAQLAGQAWARGRWSYAKIMQHPDQWRLQVLHVYGMLLHKEKVDLLDMPAGLGSLHKLILFDVRNHQSYTILTPLMPKEAKVVGKTRLGSYLACDGVFLMRYPYLANDGWKATPLILTQRVYLARERLNVDALLDPRGDPDSEYQPIQPTQTVSNLDLAFLRKTLFSPPKDGTGYRHPMAVDYRVAANDIRQDKQALDHAFQYLHGKSAEALKQDVNPEVTYVSLMRGNAPPEWMLGKVTHFEGLASYVRTERFQNAENGIDRIHLIIGHDTRLKGAEFTWAVACLNLPEGLRENEQIEAEGIFLKLYPYRSVEGKWHWSPLIVCRDVRRVPRAESAQSTLLYIGLGVAVLAIAFVMWYAGQGDTKDLDRIRKHVLDRRIEYDKKHPKKGGVKPPGVSTSEEKDADTEGSEEEESSPS